MITVKERREKRILWIGIVVAVVELCLVLGIVLWRALTPFAAPEGQTTNTTEESKTSSQSYVVPTVPPIPLNRFSPEDFAYNEQGYLTCVSEPCLMGIDVSSYQKEIDWEKVKAAGFSFVMIRVGGRGYGESGGLYEDAMAYKHYTGAKEAGLLVGAYMFSQAINTQEAAEEAWFALGKTIGWKLDLPLVYDWEYIDDEKRTAFVDEWTVTACIKTFCDIVKEAGREPMFYVSPWFGRMRLEELEDYPQWLALYKDHMDYKYHFDMWQYTCTGSVPGIEGQVDINLYFPPDE